MLTLQNVTYLHPNHDVLFDNLHLQVATRAKIALVGNNGSGKSTLLKFLAGDLQPTRGLVQTASKPYFVPQLFGQFNDQTVAQALGIAGKLAALHRILAGDMTAAHLAELADDWTVETRCQEALAAWGLAGLDLQQTLSVLSGGQKARVFLTGIAIHQPEIILLDEPSNHLDLAGRQLLYDFVKHTPCTLVVVSHDRSLLRLVDAVYELSKRGITVYGGNYAFYKAQKGIESNALLEDVQSKEKALRKAKAVEKETVERQQKLDARGKKKQVQAGLPTISMNTLRNNAENSTSRIKGVHTEKVEAISQALTSLRKTLPEIDKMRLGFEKSVLPHSKALVSAEAINHGFGGQLLWRTGLDFEIRSGERIALQGGNGSGKTTLLHIILGQMEPQVGDLRRMDFKAVYIDQDYSLIDDQLDVYAQAQHYNQANLPEHEVKIRLNRFLFGKDVWDKRCSSLSGGEKMRLLLCCLTMSHAPDMIVLDEPTNNLDLQNIEMLTTALNSYTGTLVLVSHDVSFLEEVGIGRVMDLPTLS